MPQFHSSTLTSTANSKISLLKILIILAYSIYYIMGELDLPERMYEPGHDTLWNHYNLQKCIQDGNE